MGSRSGWQSGGECNFTTKTDLLDTSSQAFAITDAAAKQARMRGFVNDRNRDQLGSSRLVENEAPIEIASSGRSYELRHVTGGRSDPNTSYVAGDAVVANPVAVLDEKKTFKNPLNFGFRTDYEYPIDDPGIIRFQPHPFEGPEEYPRP